MCKNKHYIPAVPPADYRGTLDKWMKQLKKLGVLDKKLPLRRVWLEEADYIKVLEACEA